MIIKVRNANYRNTLISAAVASALLAGCAAGPPESRGVAEVRGKLTALQSDASLATRAPLAIKEAESAVVAAEQPRIDAGLAAHRVYIADRKIDTARAQAETRRFEDQRASLALQRESARLDARTREADAATSQMAEAQADSARDKLAADQARGEVDAARADSASAAQQSSDLQRRIDALEARETDRGLVLTLGDVLFRSGRAELKPEGMSHLDKLIAFLKEYPNRTVMIEGYTDNIGSEDYNQGLSQRRAESVQAYLVAKGVGSMRLTALGRGESSPVASNEFADDRQQNRRVEIIISDPAVALR
jgi:outer membrane protein OmpA-like peptidoglycan-associated protein